MEGVMVATFVHESFSAERVRAFGATLAADPMLAIILADTLFRGAPFTGAAAAARVKFDALSPWEQAGAIDELRDALDMHLGAKFKRYVETARLADEAAEAEKAIQATSQEVG
jgi:hypothetical protein